MMLSDRKKMENPVYAFLIPRANMMYDGSELFLLDICDFWLTCLSSLHYVLFEGGIIFYLFAKPRLRTS
jgi:hypothetical protein